MSYIGQTLPTDVFGGYTTDTFAGDGSATTFTLSQAPFNEQGLIVVINNVIQQPTTNYTVSGTTLTIVGTAVASGDVIYARHTGVALPIGEANALDLQGQSDKLILDADADTTIRADTDDQIDFKAGGTDIFQLTATTATINDGTTITTADNTDTLTLVSTDADANVGPNLNLYRNSSSPADDDVLGLVIYNGQNDNNETIIYARQISYIKDASDGTEDGQLTFQTMVAGTTRDRLNITPTEIVLNEDSQDLDFRVESNGNANMCLVDAGNECVSIGQSTDMGALLNVTSGTSGAAEIKVGSTIGGTGSAYGGHLNLFLGAQSNTGSGNADTQAGDHLGRISFNGQGTDYSYQGAEIDVVVQTGDGSDDRSAQGIAMVLKTMNVGNTGYSENFRIAQNGDLTATDTSISSNSDERLKENIQDYTYDIAKFKQFKPRTFDWKNPLEHDGKSNNRGFIAQEIIAIDDYWTEQVDISMKQAEGNPAKDLDLIPAESNGMHLAYTSKLGKKDAMYISIIQQLITRIEALEG